MDTPSRCNGARRSLVRAGAALAAMPLAGCASLLRERMPEFEVAKPLAPLSASTAAAVTGATPNLDAHAHIFNARDVPVRGMLEGPIAHSLRDPKLAALVQALAPIAQALAHLAPSPASEMRMLRDLFASYAPFSEAKAIAQFDEDLIRRRDQRLQELQKALNKDGEFVRRYREIVGPATLKSVDQISLETLRAAAYRGSGFEGLSIEPRELRGAAKDVEATLSLDGVLRFATHMLSPRVDNLRSYIKAYGAGSPGVPLAGAVGAMVEFNYWLGPPCNASRMLDQVKLYERLVRLSGGFLLPLVGYNPATDMKEDGASLQVVENAIEQHGCVGVKIYPPNGFLPYGNGTKECPLPEHLPDRFDGAELDRRLGRLYELCAGLGVPVLAHANMSMGSDDAHDDLAGPCGWGALDHAADVHVPSLQVNVGHLGGDGGDKSTWTANFVKLMGDAKRLRLFGDLGFWDRLGTDRAAAGRLVDALRATLQRGQRGADRVMYGSDWMMMVRVAGYERFPATVLQVLQGEGIGGDDIRKVFGGNALACFGLRKTDMNFARFAEHFGPEVMARAAWAG